MTHLDYLELKRSIDKLDTRQLGVEGRMQELALTVQGLKISIDTLIVAMGGLGVPTEEAQRLVEETARRFSRRTMLVLVVEDNELMRKAYRRAFTFGRTDIAVLEATSVAGAIPFLEAYGARLDLVVLDYALPDGDGLEVLRKLRSLPGGPTVPVVVSSAYGDDIADAAYRASGRGAVCYVIDKTDAREWILERLNNGGFDKPSSASRDTPVPPEGKEHD